MNKGLEIYRNIIDELVKMSRSCADANAVKKGNIQGIDAEVTGANDILNRLSDRERDILAGFILDVYHAGIYDTLEQLEWLRCCKDMVITVEGEVLPMGKYEGIACDYIGRRADWVWPED